MGNGEREDENRKLAEWIGIEPTISWHALTADESAACMSFNSKEAGEIWLESQAKNYPEYFGQYHIGSWTHYPHFRTDEHWNAMLLEKMPAPNCYRMSADIDTEQPWRCIADCRAAGAWVQDHDRKTAIVLAALALLNERGRG